MCFNENQSCVPKLKQIKYEECQGCIFFFRNSLMSGLIEVIEPLENSTVHVLQECIKGEIDVLVI